MKRFAFLVILIPLLVAFPQSSQAYSSATGCVVDGKTGQPWAYGGKVTVEYPAGTGNYINYTTELDSNGCFTAQLWPSGVHDDGTLHIDPYPGPLGDPDEILCQIPADDTTENYECGTMSTNTGPNAVSLLKTTVTDHDGLAAVALKISFIGLIIAVTIFLASRAAFKRGLANRKQ